MTQGSSESYRIVDMPVIASPCRSCQKEVCNRHRCSSLLRIRKRLKAEFSGYGIAENNY